MSFIQNLKKKFIKYVPEKERKAYPNLLYISALGVTGSIITRKSNALVKTVTPISLMLAGTYVWYPQTSKNVALALNSRMKSMIQRDQLKSTLTNAKDVQAKFSKNAAQTFKNTTEEVKGRVNKVQKEANRKVSKAQKNVEKAQKEVKGKLNKAQKEAQKEVKAKLNKAQKEAKNVKSKVEKAQKDVKGKIEKAKK